MKKQIIEALRKHDVSNIGFKHCKDFSKSELGEALKDDDIIHSLIQYCRYNKLIIYDKKSGRNYVNLEAVVEEKKNEILQFLDGHSDCSFKTLAEKFNKKESSLRVFLHRHEYTVKHDKVVKNERKFDPGF